jgi:hypothetical protein
MAAWLHDGMTALNMGAMRGNVGYQVRQIRLPNKIKKISQMVLTKGKYKGKIGR